MGFLFFLLATLLLAASLAPLVLPEDPEEDWGERSASVMLLWFAILICINWMLAMFHALTGKALYICSVFSALIGAGMLKWTWRKNRPNLSINSLNRMIPILCFGMGMVIFYTLVRSFTLGPVVEEFDALSYHFPKAVEILRARTVPHIICGDFRIAYFPWNYELLLADALLLTPGDGLSFLIPLAAYLGFLASVYSVFRRAWPSANRQDLLAGLMVVAATPILILHITANKNDVLSVFFQMAFLLWFTRWCLDGDNRCLGLAFASFVLVLGTKTSALFLGPAALFMIWRRRAVWIRQLPTRKRMILVPLVSAGLLFLFLGGGWLLLNLHWTGHLLGDCSWAGGISSYEANAAPRYTFRAISWRFPVMLFWKPFSSNEMGVWAIGQGRYWFWPSYRIIYGHFGWLCSGLLTLLPFSRFFSRGEENPGQRFRRYLTFGILAFVFFCMPQKYRVDGLFCAWPRYLLCIPVIIALWTVIPVLGWLHRRNQRLIHFVLLLTIIFYFASQHWICFKNDEVRPFSRLLAAMENSRPSEPQSVAGLLDHIAGPRDAIALDGGYGALYYPAYGSLLGRPLYFLRPDPRHVSIPADVKWVIVDRSWNSGWSHPGVTTTANFWLPIKPRPTEEDVAVLKQLYQDPEWVLIFSYPMGGQAIFRKNPIEKHK